MNYELLKQFDEIIASAPVDFLGCGGDLAHAKKEEEQWESSINLFRKNLTDLIEKQTKCMNSHCRTIQK